MEATNAFIGKTSQPTAGEIAAALGSSAEAWAQFVQWLDEQCVTTQEWKSSAAKYGWSLRLKRKDRTIVYLAPCSGCFRVSLVLGNKAMETVGHTRFPKPVATAIHEAPHYAEGTGIRLVVKDAKDLPPIRALTSIKLAH